MFGCFTWGLCLFMDLGLVTLSCEGPVLTPLYLEWLWRLDGNDQCVCCSNLMWWTYQTLLFNVCRIQPKVLQFISIIDDQFTHDYYNKANLQCVTPIGAKKPFYIMCLICLLNIHTTFAQFRTFHLPNFTILHSVHINRNLKTQVQYTGNSSVPPHTFDLY